MIDKNLNATRGSEKVQMVENSFHKEIRSPREKVKNPLSFESSRDQSREKNRLKKKDYMKYSPKTLRSEPIHS